VKDTIGKLLKENNMPDTPTARAIYRKMLEPDATPPAAQRPWVGLTDEELNVEPVVNEFNRGVEAAQQRLMQMHRIATKRHNFYGHAAIELAKLKETT